MGTLYLIFFALSMIYLLSSLLGGDIDSDIEIDTDAEFEHDGADDSPKVFSLRVLAGGLLGFSIGGGSMFLNDKILSTQILVGAAVAIGFAILSYFLARGLYGMQGNSNTTIESVVGRNGSITVQTSKTGTAMVKVSTSAGAQEFICIENTNSKLKIGDSVKIEERIGNQLVVSKK